MLHTGQHYDPELSEVFFRELGLGEPRYQLDVRDSDSGRMRAGIREAVADERARLGARLRRHELDLAGAEAAGERARRARRGRAAQLRPDDAGGAQPDRGRRDRRRCCSARTSARRGSSSSEGVDGPDRGRRRRDGRRVAALRAARARALGRARAARARARRLRRRDRAPPGERDRRRSGCGGSSRGFGRVEGPLVFPAHPRTRAALARLGLDLPTIAPLGYLDFAALASQARVILTDSGGLQKEAYWYGVPCVTLRPSTEWVDTVAAGANVLVDDDPDAIAAAAGDARIPDDATAALRRRVRERARGSRSVPFPPVNPRRLSIAVWDVAVIGAGYVGVPLAQTFADAGRRVLLVDAVPGGRRRAEPRREPHRGRRLRRPRAARRGRAGSRPRSTTAR